LVSLILIANGDGQMTKRAILDKERNCGKKSTPKTPLVISTQFNCFIDYSLVTDLTTALIMVQNDSTKFEFPAIKIQ
jgi:hypothetical protein